MTQPNRRINTLNRSNRLLNRISHLFILNIFLLLSLLDGQKLIARLNTQHLTALEAELLNLEWNVHLAGHKSTMEVIEDRLIEISKEHDKNPFAFYLIANVYLKRYDTQSQNIMYLKKAATIAENLLLFNHPNSNQVDLLEQNRHKTLAKALLLSIAARYNPRLQNPSHLFLDEHSYFKGDIWRLTAAKVDLLLSLGMLTTWEQLRDLWTSSLGNFDRIPWIIIHRITQQTRKLAHKSGDVDVFSLMIKKWIESFPHPSFHLSLARLMHESQDWKEAAYHFLEAKRLNSDEVFHQIVSVFYSLFQTDLIFYEPEHKKRILTDKFIDNHQYLLSSVNHHYALKDYFKDYSLSLDLSRVKLDIILNKKNSAIQSLKDLLIRYQDRSTIYDTVDSLLVAFVSDLDAYSFYMEVKDELEPKPNFFQVLARLAYRKGGSFKSQGQQFYRDSSLLDPKNARHQAGIALDFYDLGEFELSSEFFSKAVQLEPNNPYYLYNLACTQSLVGSYHHAWIHLKKAMSINPRLRYNAAKDPDLKPLLDSNHNQDPYGGDHLQKRTRLSEH